MIKNDNNLFRSLMLRCGAYDFYSTFVRILFLKYVLKYPEKLNINNVDDFKEFNRIKNDIEDSKLDFQNPYKFLKNIENLFGFIDSKHYISFGDIRFRDQIKYFENIANNSSQFADILKLIDVIRIDDNPVTIRSYLKAVSEYCINDVTRKESFSSNEIIRELASIILNVNKNDIYCDPFCGFSSSLFSINNFKEYIGIDNNVDAVSTSLMIAFMTLNQNYKIIYDNFYRSEYKNRFDKIFAEPPVSIRFSDYGYENEISKKYGTKESNVVSIKCIIDALKTNGEAIIAVPGQTLFSEKNAYIDLRKDLVKENLKSVIALPPLFAGTVIQTFLLHIKKGFKEDIAFIDGSGLFEKKIKKYIYSDEAINKIFGSVKKCSNIEMYSQVVDRNKIRDDFNLLPNRYIQFETKKYRDVKVIDKEINELMSRIKNNLLK